MNRVIGSFCQKGQPPAQCRAYKIRPGNSRKKTGRSERAVRAEAVAQKELIAESAIKSEPYRPSEGQPPARGIKVGF